MASKINPQDLLVTTAKDGVKRLHRPTCKRVAEGSPKVSALVEDGKVGGLARATAATCCKPSADLVDAAQELAAEEFAARISGWEAEEANDQLADLAQEAAEDPELVEADAEALDDEATAEVLMDEDGVTPVDEDTEGDHPELAETVVATVEAPAEALVHAAESLEAAAAEVKHAAEAVAAPAPEKDTRPVKPVYLDKSKAPRYHWKVLGREVAPLIAEAFEVDAKPVMASYSVELRSEDAEVLEQAAVFLAGLWASAAAAVKTYRKTDADYAALPPKGTKWSTSERFLAEQKFLRAFAADRVAEASSII